MGMPDPGAKLYACIVSLTIRSIKTIPAGSGFGVKSVGYHTQIQILDRPADVQLIANAATASVSSEPLASGSKRCSQTALALYAHVVQMLFEPK